MGSESGAAVKSDGTNLPFKSLGKYLIERKLGQGGMGTVYLAKNVELKKLIALKVLPQDKAKNPILVRRFKAEAQAAAQLQHNNIVAVYDSGEADGYLYIAMEFVDGIDLFEQVKRRGVIPVKRSIDIIKQVAAALQEASEKNIVHRDIKPSNLLLRRDGVVKVTDLGLARSIDDTLETDITRAGTTVGTVDYMAPEQARNSKAADIRSDIYSLGCTWYQMLTGEPPFPEGSLTNKLQAHAIKPLPDPRELNENVPEGLFAVLQRMTAKKPEDRYQTPAELLDDLNTSKLTKAAFSNEIFSDLSDYDLVATEKFPAEEGGDDGAVGASIEPQEDEPLRKKTRSRVEDDSAEIASEPVRRKKRPSDDGESDEPDETPRRKPRSRDAETIPVEETQPMRSRQKPLSKVRDNEVDAEGSDRPSKRTVPTLDDDEPEEPSSPKRKKTSPLSDETKSTSAKNGRATSASATSDKKALKSSPKALPPKRQAAPAENDDEASLNIDPLKYVGIAAGVLAVIGGLGFLIFRWSNQLDVPQHPIVYTPVSTPVVEPEKKVVSQPDTTEKNPMTVSVVDPPKAGALDRPMSDYDITKHPVPAWATNAAADPNDLPVFSVGPGVVSETHFSSLDDALQAATNTGGVLRLLGNGPFMLSRAELGNAKRVVIAAATPQDRPLIILKADESGNIGGLTVKGAMLDLRGLHFALDRIANPNNAKCMMISVSDGQLYVRNCSFTATGSDAVPATALSFISVQDSQVIPVLEPNVLLDRVTVRGNGLTALEVHRVHADIVVQESLLVTGTAPAIDVDGHLLPGIADVFLQKPRRTIRVLRSTLCTRTRILELGAELASKPPTTAILFQDSVCSAEGSGNSAVLASATKWPSVTSTSSGWLINLSWMSLSTLYLGFDRLLDLDKSSFKVTDLETWQRVWGKKFSPTQFQHLVWQESTIPELSSILPYDFDPAKLPYLELKTGSGALPGCPITRLQVPDVISQSRLFAISQRPKLPAVVAKPAEPSQLKKVDLAKEDLGLILNKNDWPSGTVFEVSGSGLKFMSPAKIVGKSVRIIFRQGDGPQLKVQPKVSEQKTKPDTAGLFNVENGLLDLQSVVLEVSQSVKGAAPPWLINAKNASLIIRGCQLDGPLQLDLEQHQGLIQWTTRDSNPPAAGTEPPFLSVNNSLLLSHGTGIRAECSQGNVFLRNCIMAIRGNGINFLPVRSGDKLLANLDLEHVTFSTTRAAIRVEAAPGTGPISSPLRMFIDYCAVVPPFEIKAGESAESTVVECVGPVREQKQIEWWGTSNGVAKDVKVFVRIPDTDPITSVAGWQAEWGESNVIRLLTGAKGVHLANHLPNKWINLKATSFALDPKSTGATWADGGRPVGAEVRLIEDAILAKKASPINSPASATNSAPAQSGVVNTKKDVGF